MTHAITDSDIEKEIVAKGLTAPRVTPADIEANIIGVYYFTASNGVDGAHIERHGHLEKTGDVHEELALLTFCVLVLKNGFTVTGKSACASPENFDAELGRKVAHQNAIDQCWPLMGYALKEKLQGVK
jgi:hypothetical protein